MFLALSILKFAGVKIEIAHNYHPVSLAAATAINSPSNPRRNSAATFSSRLNTVVAVHLLLPLPAALSQLTTENTPTHIISLPHDSRPLSPFTHCHSRRSLSLPSFLTSASTQLHLYSHPSLPQRESTRV
ncbi:hypothetical protein ACFE04_006653 [Oxalis oulophora]